MYIYIDVYIYINVYIFIYIYIPGVSLTLPFSHSFTLPLPPTLTPSHFTPSHSHLPHSHSLPLPLSQRLTNAKTTQSKIHTYTQSLGTPRAEAAVAAAAAAAAAAATPVCPTLCLSAAREATLYTWGANKYGELGHGDMSKKTVPKRVKPLKGSAISLSNSASSMNLFAVCMGSAHAVALAEWRALGGRALLMEAEWAEGLRRGTESDVQHEDREAASEKKNKNSKVKTKYVPTFLFCIVHDFVELEKSRNEKKVRKEREREREREIQTYVCIYKYIYVCIYMYIFMY